MGIENSDALVGDDHEGEAVDGSVEQERPESREERIDRAVRDDAHDELDPEERRRAAARADSQRQQGIHQDQSNVDGALNEYEQQDEQPSSDEGSSDNS